MPLVVRNVMFVPAAKMLLMYCHEAAAPLLTSTAFVVASFGRNPCADAEALAVVLSASNNFASVMFVAASLIVFALLLSATELSAFVIALKMSSAPELLVPA